MFCKGATSKRSTSSQILGVDADSRDRIGQAIQNAKSRTMNLTSFHKQAALPIPASMDIPVSPANCCKTLLLEHLLQAGKSPRNRTCALALISQRVTYHGHVSRDESGGISETTSYRSTFQHRLGEHPPSVLPLLPIHGTLTHGAQLEVFLTFALRLHQRNMLFF
jgi:hypothetical protein